MYVCMYFFLVLCMSVLSSQCIMIPAVVIFAKATIKSQYVLHFEFTGILILSIEIKAGNCKNHNCITIILAEENKQHV